MFHFNDFVLVLYPSAIQSVGWTLILYALVSAYKQTKLRRDGEKCIAIVRDKRVSHGAGKDASDTYYMTIEFITNDAELQKSKRLHISHESSISGSFFAEIETGQILNIIYDPNKPLNYCMDDDASTFATYCNGICGYVVGLALQAFIFVSIPVYIEEYRYVFIGIGLQLLFIPMIWVACKLLWQCIQYLDKIQNKKIDPISEATDDQILQFQRYQNMDGDNINTHHGRKITLTIEHNIKIL